jgi:hypothetical protein
MTDISPKQVAKHLDRRQMRRKVLLWGALAGAIALAIVYLTCGKGWGIGGSGLGNDSGSGKALMESQDAGPRRCAIFVASEGITVDGAKMTRDEAVAACKQTTGADVVVAGDARRGDWDDLKVALDAAKIEIFKKEPSAAPLDAGAR